MHVAAPEEARQLQAVVAPRFDIAEWLYAELSPAPGVHTGPGMVGVGFFAV
jgi:fatty acid-binding protein DegV